MARSDSPAPGAPGAALDAAGLAGLAGAAGAADQAAAPPPPGGEKEPPPTISTDQVVKSMLTPMFTVMLPGWRVTEEEIEALSIAYGAVLDKYFPDGIPFGIELSAVMITIVVFGPRIRAMRAQEKARKEREKDVVATVPARGEGSESAAQARPDAAG